MYRLKKNWNICVCYTLLLSLCYENELKLITTMKKTLFCMAVTLLSASFALTQNWKPAGDKIKTQWAEHVTPANVWKEYPRPSMERSDWKKACPRSSSGLGRRAFREIRNSTGTFSSVSGRYRSTASFVPSQPG